MMLYLAGLLFLAGAALAQYTFFSDYRGIGIRGEDGEICLLLSFGVQMINENLGKDAPWDTLALSDAVLEGHCATAADKSSSLSARLTHNNRTKALTFDFEQASVLVDRYQQLRWLLQVSYIESYQGLSVTFSSSNASSSPPMSGPVKQKFTCRDNINATLTSPGYEPVRLFFTAPLEIRPYGLSSNIYLCERTRKRSLSESLEMKTTIASGVVLLLSPMAVIVGHTLRRHLIPERKAAYDNLG